MKKTENVMYKFKSLDLFGIGITFLVKGKEKTRSVFGATISLLYAALICAYALYQF